MATICYYLRQNPTATATDAPYIIQVVPNGVVSGTELVDQVVDTVTCGKDVVNSVIASVKRIIKEKCAEGWTVDAGIIRAMPKVRGGAPFIDSPYDSETQTYQIQAYGAYGLSDCTKDLVPVRISAEDLAASIRVSNVMDIASGTFGLIDGTNQALLTGNGITFDQEGEYLKLLNKKTLTAICQANVISTNKGQRAKFSLPNTTAVAEGDYYLEAATKGLIGLDEPNIYRKPVHVSAIVPPIGPSVTKVTTSLGDNKARYNLAATVTGTNLNAVKKISYHFFNDQSEECDTGSLDCEMTCSADGTTLTISSLPDATSSYGIPQGTWDFSFYNDNDTRITGIDNVEYVPA